MLATDKAPPPAAIASWSGEVSTGALLDALANHTGKTLLFEYDGRAILAGYHVTEVKTARFAALDCGANPETWAETIIQLWDVPPEAGRPVLSVGTFLAIMRKFAGEVGLDRTAKLTFEVSDPASALQLFGPARVAADATTPAHVPAFVAAQLVGTLAAVGLSGWLFQAWKR
jgi:hypothetical protein